MVFLLETLTSYHIGTNSAEKIPGKIPKKTLFSRSVIFLKNNPNIGNKLSELDSRETESSLCTKCLLVFSYSRF